MNNSHSSLGDLTSEQYQTLIRQGSDAISIVAKDGTIRYQSPNSAQIKGWEPDSLVGENIFDYIHPDDQHRVIENFQSLVDTDGYIDKTAEFRFKTKNRGWIWLEVTGASPGTDAPIDGYITTSRDISERKKREQQIATQRDDLELLNSVLRHDLRNDLQVVIARLDVLSDHVDETGRESLEAAHENAQDAIDLTTTARDLSEIMLAEEAETQQVNLKPILTDVIDHICSAYPDAKVTVEGTIPQVTVTANELLDSVFVNLLSNAIQHNDKAMAEVTVSVSRDKETILIQVADNGPGIPDDQKEEIFGKGDAGLESSGTGMGLYLAQSLVDIYRGDIWVEDNDPEGSVFQVELSMAE